MVHATGTERISESGRVFRKLRLRFDVGHQETHTTRGNGLEFAGKVTKRTRECGSLVSSSILGDRGVGSRPAAQLPFIPPEVSFTTGRA